MSAMEPMPSSPLAAYMRDNGACNSGTPLSFFAGDGKPFRGLPRLLAVSAAVFLCAAGAYGAKQAAAPQAGEAKPAEEAKPAGPATYVGSEVCQACHEDIFKSLQKNPHHVVETSNKAWKGKACESCHGPGSRHAESAAPADIVQPAKLSASGTDRTCLKCHANAPTHVGRLHGGHGKGQVSCAACHSVHKGQMVARKAPEVNAQCASCHTSQWASFQRPYRHRLPQGAMSCVDCHNPHGSLLPRQLQTAAANEPGCIRCHGDKRGPFVFEHAPVRMEGCHTCHEPHGSANPRMLTRHEVRYTCLECHTNLPTPAIKTSLGGVPPALHDLRQPRFRQCTNCHVKIHGSNVNRSLMR